MPSFERIHPFTDGNGRTGRLLISKQLLAKGYAPVVIPIDYRAEYLNILASQNVESLSNLLRKLNEYEVNRMSQFGIKL